MHHETICNDFHYALYRENDQKYVLNLFLKLQTDKIFFTNTSTDIILTKYALVTFESPLGKGVYTAKAIQFAKIVNRIKYSKGL